MHKVVCEEVMHKVVYHPDWGSFGLAFPRKILNRYNELAGTDYKDGYDLADNVIRHDKNLVQAVEEYIESEFTKPSDSSYQIEEIKGNRYRIDEYDGWETVNEPEDLVWVKIENE